MEKTSPETEKTVALIQKYYDLQKEGKHPTPAYFLSTPILKCYLLK